MLRYFLFLNKKKHASRKLLKNPKSYMSAKSRSHLLLEILQLHPHRYKHYTLEIGSCESYSHINYYNTSCALSSVFCHFQIVTECENEEQNVYFLPKTL